MIFLNRLQHVEAEIQLHCSLSRSQAQDSTIPISIWTNRFPVQWHILLPMVPDYPGTGHDEMFQAIDRTMAFLVRSAFPCRAMMILCARVKCLHMNLSVRPSVPLLPSQTRWLQQQDTEIQNAMCSTSSTILTMDVP